MNARLDELQSVPRLEGALIDVSDPQLTEPHPVALNIDEKASFANRFDAARYLHSILGEGRIEDPQQDLMLWGWLSALYFDQLCPADASGTRKVRQRARYMPSTDYTTRYRHLLLGPFRIYQSHAVAPEQALAALTGSLDTPGELAEQISARVELVATPSIIAAATLLYIDGASGKPRRGAAGAGRGSVRRFGVIVRQYDMTWDLAGMSPEAIVARLPREFDRFRDD
jgi:hypothetical protein